MRSISTLRLHLATALCLISLNANAQTKDAPKDSRDARPAAAAPAPVGANPERTTASFGDWILRCETPPQQKRVCEVAQIVTLQGQANPIAQVAFGRAAANEPMHVTVVLPTNIAIGTKPQIGTAKTGGQTADLTWQNCTPMGCFASREISDDVVTAFGKETEPGRLAFKDAAGRDVALQFSFKGLAQAVAALAKDI